MSRRSIKIDAILVFHWVIACKSIQTYSQLSLISPQEIRSGTQTTVVSYKVHTRTHIN